jgi:hypothetical protein
VSTAGTTNLKQITSSTARRGLGMNIPPGAKDHAEAFLMVETGRAAAFFMDDILLYSLVANSKSPADYVISSDALSVEPYGRHDAGATIRASRRWSTTRRRSSTRAARSRRSTTSGS